MIIVEINVFLFHFPISTGETLIAEHIVVAPQVSLPVLGSGDLALQPGLL